MRFLLTGFVALAVRDANPDNVDIQQICNSLIAGAIIVPLLAKA